MAAENGRRLALPELKRFEQGTVVPSEQLVDEFTKAHLNLNPEEIKGAKSLIIRPGETLVTEGADACCVYLPKNNGFSGKSGENITFDVSSGQLLGETGVIRGAPRNATVTNTSDHAIEVIAIPKEDFLKTFQQSTDSNTLVSVVSKIKDTPHHKRQVEALADFVKKSNELASKSDAHSQIAQKAEKLQNEILRLIQKIQTIL